MGPENGPRAPYPGPPGIVMIPGSFALVQWLTQPAGQHGEPSRRELSGPLRELGAGLARYSGLEAA